MAYTSVVDALSQLESGLAGVVRRASVTLTDAQIKQLPVSPALQLIPAPGANKIICPVATVALTTFSQTYTGAASMASLWSGTPGGVFVMLMDQLADLATSLTILSYGILQAVLNSDALINKPTYVIATNAGAWPAAALTGGNAGNRLTVTCYYMIIDVS
jgi:hypothetical protein